MFTEGADAAGPTPAGKGTWYSKSDVFLLQTSKLSSHLPLKNTASKPILVVVLVSHFALGLPIRLR